MDLIEKALLLANRQWRNNVREATGNNDGPQVEAFLKKSGSMKGQPWCAAFLYWILVEAGIKAGLLPSISAFGTPASVRWWRKWAATNTILKDNADGVQRGDIFFWYNVITMKGHIGIIAEKAYFTSKKSFESATKVPDGQMPDEPGAWIRTYEGNASSDPNDREGNRVVQRWRKCTPSMRYIALVRYAEGLRRQGKL